MNEKIYAGVLDDETRTVTRRPGGRLVATVARAGETWAGELRPTGELFPSVPTAEVDDRLRVDYDGVRELWELDGMIYRWVPLESLQVVELQQGDMIDVNVLTAYYADQGDMSGEAPDAPEGELWLPVDSVQVHTIDPAEDGVSITAGRADTAGEWFVPATFFVPVRVAELPEEIASPEPEEIAASAAPAEVVRVRVADVPAALDVLGRYAAFEPLSYFVADGASGSTLGLLCDDAEELFQAARYVVRVVASRGFDDDGRSAAERVAILQVLGAWAWADHGMQVQGLSEVAFWDGIEYVD